MGSTEGRVSSRDVFTTCSLAPLLLAKGLLTWGETQSQSSASRIQGVKRSHWAMNR